MRYNNSWLRTWTLILLKFYKFRKKKDFRFRRRRHSLFGKKKKSFFCYHWNKIKIQTKIQTLILDREERAKKLEWSKKFLRQGRKQSGKVVRIKRERVKEGDEGREEGKWKIVKFKNEYLPRKEKKKVCFHVSNVCIKKKNFESDVLILVFCNLWRESNKQQQQQQQ